MTAPILEVRVMDGVCRLTLNRPEKRNALNGELIAALAKALDRASLDEAVHVVAITGAGGDFCAGGDLAELERTFDQGHAANVADAMTLGNLFIQMRSHPKPIVALVQGRALAGGCGLATACDLVVAHRDAELGYPEVDIGFVPAMVMAILRRKVTESVAFELVTTGERITAERAERIGLVNRVLDAGDFEKGASRFLETLARKPASALELSKGLLYELDQADFEADIRKGAEVNAIARRSDACRAGVSRFLGRSRG